MCQINIPQEVLDVISEFVRDEKVFTAHDVTREARTRTSANVRHGEVRLELNHQMATQMIPDYNRCIGNLDIVSGKTQPLVYFPDGKSENDHPLSLGTQRAGVAVIDNSTDDTDDDDEEDGVIRCRVTKEKRLEIPHKILSQASPAVGTYYHIRINGSVLAKSPIKSGRVRVSLGSLGITTQDTIKICVDDNKNIQLDY